MQFKLCNLLAAGLLFGCQPLGGMNFPVSSVSQEANNLSASVNIIRVDSQNIRTLSPEADILAEKTRNSLPLVENHTYRVGAGDIIIVNLWDDPNPAGDINEGPRGLTVSESGTIFYPFVGEFSVSGKTVSEIREDMTRAISEYVRSPQVYVSVAEFNAHRATVVGAVANPGRIPITNIPLTLLDAINEASALQDADLSNITLRRNGRDYSVNLAAYVSSADEAQNPLLSPGDVVIINTQRHSRVYTFGEIGVGEFILDSSQTSLTDVIAQRGGINKLRANARGVFVFREILGQEKLTVYQFALEQPAILVLSQAFRMRDGDVLYVTTDPISRWNDTVTKILSPVVTTIRAQAVVAAVEE